MLPICIMILLYSSYTFANSDISEINNTFKLLNEGDEKIILRQDHKNITLVIGNTGDGKTTLTQWIAGDDSKLIAQEFGENTGEFIIGDGNRISNSTINSKTTFPELVLDDKTNAAFYDCPGFSDTRSVSYDIAGTYFLKKLTDHADGFKIILVVTYHSVREGVDRLNFMTLMKHTTDFIRDVKQFQNSLAMVVTKVDNQHYYDRKVKGSVLVPDENIIRNIAKFLANVKQGLEERLAKDIYYKEQEFYKSAIQLLDILLLKNGGKYTRIGLFRRPNEPGPLSDIILLQDGKQHIEEMLHDGLVFGVKSDGSFGYTVSDKSKNEINSLVGVIKNNIRSNTTGIISEIEQYCHDLVDQVNNEIELFTESVSLDVPSLGKVQIMMTILPVLLKEVESSRDVEHLSDRINSTLKQLEINCPACVKKTKHLATQGRYYNFLQTVHGGELDPTMWESQFHPLENCLDRAKKIKINILDKAETADRNITNRKIKHLTEKEMEEYYQKEFGETEIEDLSKLALEFTTNTLFLARYRKSLKLLKILNNGKSATETPKWTTQVHDILKQLHGSEVWYAYLDAFHNELSKYENQKSRNEYNNQWTRINQNNFDNKVDFSHPDFNVTDERLKEINHVLDLGLSHKVGRYCEGSGKLVIKGNFIKMSDITLFDGKIKNPCDYNLSSVDIFALDMIIIDRDFDGVGNKLQLSIVAPKWHVEGTKEINLDGAPGKSIYPSNANSGYYDGGHGANGKPGFPGGPAGNFLGIANEIANGWSLTITANGGPGGPGQNGGIGANGRDGENARAKFYRSRELIDQDKLITVIYNKNHQLYRLYGTFGTRGGDGGHGGEGGSGGFEGTVKIINLLESSASPNTGSFRGAKGDAGKGGWMGRGGVHGNDLRVWYCNKYVLFIPIQIDSKCEEKVLQSFERAPYGSEGKNGFNNHGKMLPKEPQTFQDVPAILNQYKHYIRENVVDRFQSRSLKRFLYQLETSKKIEDLYDTLALANEFLLLEKQADRLDGLKKDDIIYFYQLFLNRTEEHAKHQKNVQHKQFLSTLYTAALIRIYNLRSDSANNLIIDIELNLDLLTEDLITLKDLKQKNKKVTIINRHKVEYKAKINKQIQEAESLITGQIIPQIKEIDARTSNQIQLLANELSTLQEEAEHDKTALIQKKRKIEETLTMNYVFGNLKFIGQLALCFVELGSAVGLLTETTSLIGESLVTNGERQSTELQLPNEIVSTIRSINDIIRSKELNVSTTKSTISATEYGKRTKTLDDAIEQANRNILKLQQYEATIYNTLKPLMTNITKNIDDVANHLDSKSKVSLEITKWQVQKVLRDLKMLMRKFTIGFHVEENLARCMESLEEVMVILINIFDQIQNYQHQKELADYIADISISADSNNWEIQEVANELEISIRSNLVLKQYQIAIDALKQQTFPLAHLYLDESVLPSHLMLEENLENLVDKTAKQIETIKRKMKEYKSSITHHDKYMNCGWFNNEYKSAEPFFVWENGRYRNLIHNLLSGKKVVVKADILIGHPDKNAIKFNMIGINFRSNDSSTSSEIQKKLKGFTVNATHLGNSYYRFKNNIYVITGSSQHILYSFEKDGHGNPVRENNVYKKIKSGDLMLSPYAMWEIQLINTKSKIPFELEKYGDKVDLELIGNGCYLSKELDISVKDVKKYYKEDDDLSSINYDNLVQ